MEKLQNLWEIAEEHGVYVSFASLRKQAPGLLGAYISNWPAIFLDESLKYNHRLQKCILAEELGHHFTAPRADFPTVYRSFKQKGVCSESIMMAQDEQKALLWATRFLVPDVEFYHQLSKGFLLHEIADYYQVTEWLLYRKIYFMTRKDDKGKLMAEANCFKSDIIKAVSANGGRNYAWPCSEEKRPMVCSP